MGRAAHGGTQMSIWTDDAVRVYVIALVVAVAHDHEYGIEQLVDRLGCLLDISIDDLEEAERFLYPDCPLGEQ